MKCQSLNCICHWVTPSKPQGLYARSVQWPERGWRWHTWCIPAWHTFAPGCVYPLLTPVPFLHPARSPPLEDCFSLNEDSGQHLDTQMALTICTRSRTSTHFQPHFSAIANYCSQTILIFSPLLNKTCHLLTEASGVPVTFQDEALTCPKLYSELKEWEAGILYKVKTIEQLRGILGTDHSLSDTQICPQQSSSNNVAGCDCWNTVGTFCVADTFTLEIHIGNSRSHVTVLE